MAPGKPINIFYVASIWTMARIFPVLLMASLSISYPCPRPGLYGPELVIPELIDYVTFRKGPYYADVGDFSSVGTAAFHLVKTLPEGFAKLG